MTVAVDAGGADLGPAEVAAGAAIAAAAGTRVILFGPADEIGTVPDGVEVVDAPVSIAKAPDPAFAVRSTPEASIVQAAKAVADGRADALVSGGSTGSALAAGLFNLRRDRGIYRPALALPVPVPGGRPVMLLDVGANVTCRPEHLVQFAHMGSAFTQAVLGIDNPRVALLSNGEEAVKGTPDIVKVHAQLAGAGGTGLNFV
ncbi:MAG: phosphate acyltransferase, partial [Solirubrobacteraceae bacterium]